MRNKRYARNATVWALIAALVNPAVMVPWAFGRDTDIFLAIPTSVITAEPNILIVLDTSDSMNTYEGWREYQGAYDSHIEYLWNDPTYINTITATAPNAEFTNVGSSPDLYFFDYTGTCPNPSNATCPRDSGFFAGTNDAARVKLRDDALAHANATEPGDPGARSTYRNYNDASWIYWLPASTAESDNRLWSFAFNRFVGGTRVSNFSSTNGTTNPVVRAGFNFGNTNDRTLGSSFRNSSGVLNRCTASMSELLPSTVYAPTEYGRNGGKWVNQQWMRWEAWLSLENSAAASYPGSHATINVGGTDRRVGYLGTSYTSAAPGTDPTTPVTASPPAPAISAFRDNTGTQGSQGLPIRVQLDEPPSGITQPSGNNDSHAGWTSLKADLGGFNHQAVVNGMAQATLQALRGVYGYTLLNSTSASAVENERFSAWKGNRDSSTTAFGMTTGTPAYYDTRNNISATSGSTTYTCRRICGVLATGAAGPTADGRDGSNAIRQYYAPNGSGQYCSPNGTLTGDCRSITGNPDHPLDPPLCGTSGVVNYVDRNHDACAWTGRNSKYIEGFGTVFYGGTCSGRCLGAGFVEGAPNCTAGANSTTYCNQPSSGNDGANWIGNLTVDGTAYTNVTKNAVGTCSNIADTNQSCTTRKGFSCVYGPNTVANLCPTQQSTSSTGGSVTNYPVYNRQTQEANLVHDCKADEASNNGGTNVYMTNQRRNFNQGYNTNIHATNTTAAYTTTSGNATAPDAIDLYSVNYLNWKYGAKSEGGHPIGRKTRLQIAKDALSDLIAATDGVRLGLETFNALPNDTTLRGTQGSQGGKIVFPIKRMGNGAADSDYANRAALITVINSQLAKAATPLTESIYEAYLYFNGRAPRFGTASAITANFTASALPAVGGGNVTDGADATAVSAGKYVSPMMNNPTTATPSSCQKNFVVLITDGGPEKDVDANDQITPLSYAGALSVIAPDTRIDSAEPDTTSGQFETGTPSLPYGPPSIADTGRTDGGYVWLDELTYFMSQADMSPGARHSTAETSTDLLPGVQPITTYTIGFAGAASPVLENAAQKAGGKYYIAENSADLAAALISTFEDIRNFSPTVAAPTVPLSALNRAQNAADVFLAFFSPSTSQAWKGTVKRFRIGQGADDCGAGTDICLIGKTALESGNKNIETVSTDPPQVIIDPKVVSFWNPVGLMDGSEPDVGGTGYQIISQDPPVPLKPSTRNMYTYISAGATSTTLTDASNLVSEDNTRIDKPILGNASMSDAARSTLINYIRGGNTGDGACSDASSATACDTWRAWPHADVQHSRPVIVTYNSTPVPDDEVGGTAQRSTSQFLFYLTNDGLLHAINAADGREQWVFLIEEALPQINALMANNPGLSLDLADGSPAVWIDRGNNDGIVNGSERVWLFFGLRRGGRAYYALDITNVSAPRFMWKITPTQRCVATTCAATADYAQLAQSWSTPVAARVTATTGASGTRPAGNADPVVMFGGGYDPQQDTFPLPVGTTQDTIGKAVFVVEGSSGALVKSFSNVASDFLNASAIDWSIPSDLTVVNIDLDAQGLLDRIVVGDVGGNVWRFDISDVDATKWKGKKLAALSDTGVPNRKILFPPVIVPQLNPFPIEWHAVYVGTGDREHPLAPNTSDKIFMITDFDTGLTATAGTAASFAGGDFLDVTNEKTQAEVEKEVPNLLVTKRGWYRDLEPGEKVTGSPFVFNQKLRFATYNPSAISSECLPPGEGRLNEISALYGNLRDLSGDGTISSRDRYYAGVSRGFFSPLQTVIIGSTVYTIALAGGNVTSTTSTTAPPGGASCQAGSQFWYCREQQIGIAQRIYWYMEPEQ